MAVDYTVTFCKDGEFENGDYVLTCENLLDLTEYVLRAFADRYDSFIAHVPAPSTIWYHGVIQDEHSIFYTSYRGGEYSDYAFDEHTVTISEA